MRLPQHFRDGYLNEDAADLRASGVPADLARYADGIDGDTLRGTVIQLENPKPIADLVGHVSCSIIPAALDAIAARHINTDSTFFAGMFALFIVDLRANTFPNIDGELRALLTDAIVDHFEAIRELHGGPEGDVEAEVRDLVAVCDPRAVAYPITISFATADTPRGARLLDYLFDLRPHSFAPTPWPKTLAL